MKRQHFRAIRADRFVSNRLSQYQTLRSEPANTILASTLAYVDDFSIKGNNVLTVINICVDIRC